MTPETKARIADLEDANLAEVKRERIRECLEYIEAGHSPQALAEIFPHGCILAARHFYDVERGHAEAPDSPLPDCVAEGDDDYWRVDR